MAKASEDDSDIMLSVKQIIQNCCIEDKFDVDELTLFDIEYMFLQLRANSINDILELKYIDNEDNKEYDFKVNLKDLKVNFPDKIDMNIVINDTTGLIMKYPPASLLNDKAFLSLNDENESFLRLVAKSIDKIYDSTITYDTKDVSELELVAFIENLNINVLNSLRDFLSKTPYIEKVLEYTNSVGSKRKIVLRTLNDFFMFR